MDNYAKVTIGFACLALLGVGGFYVYKTIDNQSAILADATDPNVPPPLATSIPETTALPGNLRQYKNTAFHFSVNYPDTLQATEYKEQGGALTVTFVTADNAQSFELYVTPYSGTQIDKVRFALDEPSGTYLQPQNVVVGGTPATMFYGNNAIMGDTREVWFIKGGYLYEVTTYKALDTWLGTILQSWKFI